MTTITHHLDDATVMAFAAGTLGYAHATVVSSHISVCSKCRETLRGMEALGGGALEAQVETAVSVGCKEATMASLDGVLPMKPRAAIRREVKVDMPLALRHALNGKALSELAWKKKAPGISVYDVPMADKASGKLKLLQLAPGMAMPEHGHGGEELTLILRGSYKDHTGEYKAGDVADLDEETEHTPVVTGNDVCICLIAVEAPTKFKSVLARLAQPFVGI